MDADYIIDKIVISLMKIRFISEREELEKTNNNNTRTPQLDNIIDKLKTSESIIDGNTNKSQFNEIEKLVYSKKWVNLQYFHKITKIKEYLDKIVTDNNERTKLVSAIGDMINTKKIKYNKHLVYDSSKQQIVSMAMLKQNEKKQYYLDIK